RGGRGAAKGAGPRRIKAGAARDHVLGFAAVSGRGETFKSGGRVVKNVTGYDLSKLMAGSWGTLAAMTEVTVKVLPRPEREETLLIPGLSETDAVAAMNAALGAPAEVSGAAHLPAAVAVRAGAASGPITALRLEGIAAPIAHRRQVLEALLQHHDATTTSVADDESRILWRRIADAEPFAAAEDPRPLWRISTAPAAGARLAALIAAEAETECLYDRAGGLVWYEVAPTGVACARPAGPARGAS